MKNMIKTLLVFQFPMKKYVPLPLFLLDHTSTRFGDGFQDISQFHLRTNFCRQVFRKTCMLQTQFRFFVEQRCV